MKKFIAIFTSLVVLVASCGSVRAETDMLQALYLATAHADQADALQIVQETLAARGYQVDMGAEGDAAHDLYDVLMDICEQACGDYYAWTVTQRYQFDSLMVLLGQLPYRMNLDPASDVIDQETALNVAVSEIVNRYGAAYDTRDYQATASYYATENGSTQGMWRFGIEYASGDLFAVHVLRGEVSYCVQEKRLGDLEMEYNQLLEARGAFFKWSLEEKMEYANSLPDKLRLAQASQEINMSYDELVGISQYGFCLPGTDDLPQEEAKRIALEAVQAAYDLPANWSANAEIYYSFFATHTGECVWRVILWKTGNPVFPSGIVELNSQSGEVLKLAKNGTLPNEYLPYLDRI